MFFVIKSIFFIAETSSMEQLSKEKTASSCGDATASKYCTIYVMPCEIMFVLLHTSYL